MTEDNADEHAKRLAEELAKKIVFGLNELTSNTNLIVVGVWLTFLGVLAHVIHHW